ncbi:MAG TPA: hypothetical protein VMS77_09590 [Conexivisphaerales archaeon]|nr:hypothetical protein [Conexivisphaerales archaeon]
MSNARPEGGSPPGTMKVPGLGSLSRRLLEEQGVRTMADLARTDPYDPRFRILGEPFSSWVLYARAVVADEIIKEVEVTPGAIRVTCLKTYDRLASRNSLLGRLGMYDVYVDTEVRERPDAYEVLFRLKPEQIRFGMAQWMEYRNNALQLKAALRMKVGEPLLEAPMVEASWPLERFERDLGERTIGLDGLELVAKLYLKILTTDRFNAVVLWDREAYNRSLTRSFLDEFTPVSAHVLCGGNTPEEMQEQIVLNGNNGLVMVDDFEKATPEERRILLDLLATRRTKITYDGKRTDVSVKARFVFNLWMPERVDAPILDPDFAGLIDLVVRLPAASDREALEPAVEGGIPSAQEAKGALQSAQDEVVMEAALPEDMGTALHRFKPPKFLSGYGLRLGSAARQLAVSCARQRRSPVVELEDLEAAFDLVQRSNSTLSLKPRKGQHSV